MEDRHAAGRITVLNFLQPHVLYEENICTMGILHYNDVLPFLPNAIEELRFNRPSYIAFNETENDHES